MAKGIAVALTFSSNKESELPASSVFDWLVVKDIFSVQKMIASTILGFWSVEMANNQEDIQLFNLNVMFNKKFLQ